MTGLEKYADVSNYQKGERGETGGSRGRPETPLCEDFNRQYGNIAAKVQNDQRETCSGSRGDNQTVSPTLNKDLKLSKKSSRWLPKLRDKETKIERV